MKQWRRVRYGAAVTVLCVGLFLLFGAEWTTQMLLDHSWARALVGFACIYVGGRVLALLINTTD